MNIYQINMPSFIDNILDTPTFMWMLTPNFCSTERYKELKCFMVGGYRFDVVIINFYSGKITIIRKQHNFEAIEYLLNNFMVCNVDTMSFPTFKNKKSYTL